MRLKLTSSSIVRPGVASTLVFLFVPVMFAVATQDLSVTEAIPGIVAEQPAAGPFVAVDGGFMVPYTETIPGTKVSFDMLPIPAGGERAGRLGRPHAGPGKLEDAWGVDVVTAATPLYDASYTYSAGDEPN